MNGREIENFLNNTDADNWIVIKCGNTVVEGWKRDLKYHLNNNKMILDIRNINKAERSHFLLAVGKIHAIEHYY